jgi:hypothetical protein
MPKIQWAADMTRAGVPNFTDMLCLFHFYCKVFGAGPTKALNPIFMRTKHDHDH